jgi:hypothetical protein
MDETLPNSSRRKDAEIAAAQWLLEDTPPKAAPAATDMPLVPDSGQGFEVADLSAEVVPASSSLAAGNEAKQAQSAPRIAPLSSPPVEQVWSRMSEWGPTFVWLGGWLAIVLFLLFQTLGAELYGPSVLLFLVGGIGAVLLSYPILITLERPVRITPEQAARDYFGALSHHLPHYRRMWLLLASRGRTSSHFASFEGFKSYWAGRLDQLRQAKAGRLSPLVFKVEEFRAEKSAGKTEIDARFKVKVSVRGRQSQGPIWSLPVAANFTRGPDGMWYLNDGTLAERDGPSSPPS